MRLRAELLLVVTVACGALNLGLAGSIDEKKKAALGPSAPAAPPPEVAVPTVLLGAFRGLVVDYLWLRAMRLEDEGKFYEAKDLAEWISTLEPRLEQVWSFQAHGLAYNLSAACDDPKERWKWIKAGIELLRDKGIPLNPRAPELYFMLSRIYSDKIGGPFDDHHLFLKKFLAIELVRAFGPLGSDPDLEALARAPKDLDPPESALLAELRAAGLDLDATQGAWDEALARAAPRVRELAKQRDPELVRRVRAHFRADWARKLGLDPAKCLELDRTYGPLEWRGCDALSLYWAVEGAKAAETLGPARARKEHRRLERLAINSIKHAVRRGRLILAPNAEPFFAPEPQLVDRLIKMYDAAIADARAAEKSGEAASPDDEGEDDDGHHHEKAPTADATAALYRNSLEEARKEFLMEGVGVLARYGREAEARRVYAIFRRDYPHEFASYEALLDWLLELEVRGEGGNQVTTYQILLGNWTQAWYALARGDDAQAMGRIALADRVHREWQKKVAAFGASGDLTALQRLGTVNLVEIKTQSLKDALARLKNPALRKRLEDRAGPLLDKKEGEK
jgi:hypothetical protein